MINLFMFVIRKLEEKDYLEDLGAYRRKIFKMTFRKIK
jgi:hypothetical protein